MRGNRIWGAPRGTSNWAPSQVGALSVEGISGVVEKSPGPDGVPGYWIGADAAPQEGRASRGSPERERNQNPNEAGRGAFAAVLRRLPGFSTPEPLRPLLLARSRFWRTLDRARLSPRKSQAIPPPGLDREEGCPNRPSSEEGSAGVGRHHIAKDGRHLRWACRLIATDRLLPHSQ